MISASGKVEAERLIEGLLTRVASDLSKLIGRRMRFEGWVVEHVHARPAGRDCVHVSFKLAIHAPEGMRHGCLLIPFAEAITLAGCSMLLPDAVIQQLRTSDSPDRATKDALLEVGNFIGGSADDAVRNLLPWGHSVRSEGCQGVRADVRPALVYDEGAPLVVARARGQIEGFREFEAHVILPALAALA